MNFLKSIKKSLKLMSTSFSPNEIIQKNHIKNQLLNKTNKRKLQKRPLVFCDNQKKDTSPPSKMKPLVSILPPKHRKTQQ